MSDARRRARAVAVARPVGVTVPWWVWAALAAGLLAAAPAMAQPSGATGAVPDKIAPPAATPVPRSESPLTGGGLRPIPDTGVIKPPTSGTASPAVLQPPVSGTMPVIPPPGSPGGNMAVVPK